MDISKATAGYEKWLGRFCAIESDDLGYKHSQMRSDSFVFLRATFYRWAQHWRVLADDIRGAPTVLAVGDAHVENFGTWRDREGRLVWGVNDFDEAGYFPYTNDLVRLAASAMLAVQNHELTIAANKICPAILTGYTRALHTGGRAVVLDSGPAWLRKLVGNHVHDPDNYWQELLDLTSYPASPEHKRKLRESAPAGVEPLKYVHRRSGAGSLGRPRVAALYAVAGGYAAREIKARVPSAWVWANGDERQPKRKSLPRIWRRAVRSQDPFLAASRHWIVRRLSPDCSRINLSAIPKRKQESALLGAMGWELANVHLNSSPSRGLRAHLESLPHGWLLSAATEMCAALEEDFRIWKQKTKGTNDRSNPMN